MSWLSSAIKKTKKAVKKAGTQLGHAGSKAAHQAGGVAKKAGKQFADLQKISVHPFEIHKGKLNLAKQGKKLAGKRISSQVGKYGGTVAVAGLGLAGGALAAGAARSALSGRLPSVQQAASYAAGASDMPDDGSGGDDFFGDLSSTLGKAGGFYQELRSQFGGSSGGGGGGQSHAAARAPAESPVKKYLPWIIGGAALLLVLFVFARRK